MKSGLLELSDLLFDCNLAVRVAGAAGAAARLTQLYTDWRELHQLVTRTETEACLARIQSTAHISTPQPLGKIAKLLILALTDHKFDILCDIIAVGDSKTTAAGGGVGWGGRLARLGLVSGLLLATSLTLSFYWGAGECNTRYYNQIWPVLSFTPGPRPF